MLALRRFAPLACQCRARASSLSFRRVTRLDQTYAGASSGCQGGAIAMGYVIGTDEAGYGPNLGPLVISATVWELPDGQGAADLDRLVAECIARELPPARRGAARDLAMLVIADSKLLYKPP